MKKIMIFIFAAIMFLTQFQFAVNATANELITNGSFEEELSDSKIKGWNPVSEETADNTLVELSSKYAHSGKNSLRILDDSKTAPVGIKSDKVQVNPGSTYLLESFAYVEKASVRAYIKVFDDKGVQVQEESILSNTPKSWTAINLSIKIPKNGHSFEVWFYMGAAGISEAYIDDVSVIEYVDLNNSGLEMSYSQDKNYGDVVIAPLSQNVAYANVNGQLQQYLVLNGSPSTFYAVDALTGNQLFSETLPGVDTVWAMVVGNDGNLYFGGTANGNIYKYDPLVKKISVVHKLTSHKHMWAMKADGDSIIIGAYQKGKDGVLLSFDTQTNTLVDLGAMDHGSEYVRGLGVSDQYIYSGVGGVRGGVVRYHKSNGTKQFIEVKDAPTIIGEVLAFQNRIFVTAGQTLIIYDETSLEELNRIPFNGKHSLPDPNDSDSVYYKAVGNQLHQYSISKNTSKMVENINPLPLTALKEMTWVEYKDSKGINQSRLAFMAAYTESILFDPLTETTSLLFPDVKAQGVLLQSLEIGPDGLIYAGGYMRGLGIFNTKTERIEASLQKFHQPEGIGFMNDDVYFGTYGGAVMYRYNPKKDMAYNEFGSGNPGLAFNIEDEQDRPFVIHTYDDKLYVGTFPDYGKLGGALTIFDTKTETFKTLRNIVQDQSVVGIETDEKYIYISTSVDGGIGSTPSQTLAQVVKLDRFTFEIIKSVSPKLEHIPNGVKFIGSLSLGKDGLLWAATGIDGTLFAMNPDNLEVIKSVSLVPGATQNSGFRPYYIRWGSNNTIYTNVGKRITAIDTETMNYEQITDFDVNLFTLNEQGDIFYGKGTELHKLSILPNKVNIRNESKEIKIGDILNIQTELIDHNGKTHPVNQNSIEYIIDEKVLSNKNAILTAIHAGVTEVKVKYGELISEPIEIHIQEKNKEKEIISTDTMNIELEVGNSLQLNILGSKEIKFESMNESIALVNTSGLITAGKAGETLIKVTGPENHLEIIVKVLESIKNENDDIHLEKPEESPMEEEKEIEKEIGKEIDKEIEKEIEKENGKEKDKEKEKEIEKENDKEKDKEKEKEKDIDKVKEKEIEKEELDAKPSAPNKNDSPKLPGTGISNQPYLSLISIGFVVFGIILIKWSIKRKG